MPAGKTPLQVPGGAILPACPTTGTECAVEWDIPMEAAQQTMLKVSRPIPGSKGTSFLMDIPMLEWNAKDMVREYGPGTYHLAPGPGPFRKRAATLNADEDFALRCGWGAQAPMVMPRPSELVAGRMAMQATQGPTDPMNLAFIIQAALEPLAKKVEAIEERSKPGSSISDTLALVHALKKDGRNEMLEMFQLMKAIQSGSPLPGMDDEKPDDKGGDMLSESLRNFGEGLAKGAVAAFTAPPPAVQHLPNPVLLTRPQAPTLAPHHGATPMPLPVESPVSMELREHLAPFAQQLKGHLPMMKMFAGGVAPDRAADMLYRFIDDEEQAQAVIMITGEIGKHGVEALRWIDPSLATPHWAATVALLGQRLAQEALQDLEEEGGPSVDAD